MQSTESVIRTGREFIAFIERQLAEIRSGDFSADSDKRFEEAFQAFGPYGRALLSLSPSPSPSTVLPDGSMLSDEDLEALSLPGEGHYARLLSLSRASGCTEWEADAEVIRLNKKALRRAS